MEGWKGPKLIFWIQWAKTAYIIKIIYQMSIKMGHNNIRRYISMFHSICIHDFIKKHCVTRQGIQPSSHRMHRDLKSFFTNYIRLDCINIEQWLW